MPNEFEKQVSNAIADLETSPDIKAQLRELYIVGAKWPTVFYFKEVELGNKKVIIVYVPFPQLRQFQKIQPRLVRELEKKFSGRHVVVIARHNREVGDILHRTSGQPAEQNLFQVDTFSAVYKHLTGKDVAFEFPEPLF
uniref:40S ribosomal protein S7 n=1 Tax=Parascaris equorum TaxID=6256 RepID=A0A914R9P4_PAREQ